MYGSGKLEEGNAFNKFNFLGMNACDKVRGLGTETCIGREVANITCRAVDFDGFVKKLNFIQGIEKHLARDTQS